MPYRMLCVIAGFIKWGGKKGNLNFESCLPKIKNCILLDSFLGTNI